MTKTITIRRTDIDEELAFSIESERDVGPMHIIELVGTENRIKQILDVSNYQIVENGYCVNEYPVEVVQ